MLDRRCSLVVEYLTSMHKSLGLATRSTTKKERKEKKKRKGKTQVTP